MHVHIHMPCPGFSWPETGCTGGCKARWKHARRCSCEEVVCHLMQTTKGKFFLLYTGRAVAQVKTGLALKY